jgi:hypothetical protein
MYLIIKTQANGGSLDSAKTACAVVPVRRNVLDYLLGMMEEAAQLSDKLGKLVAITCSDWTPDWYATYPDVEAFGQPEEDALESCDPGWCLMAERPFPEEEGRAMSTEVPFLVPPRPGEPVRLSYCELRASAHEVSWSCAPRSGQVEEYTVEVLREALAGLLDVPAPERSAP